MYKQTIYNEGFVIGMGSVHTIVRSCEFDTSLLKPHITFKNSLRLYCGFVKVKYKALCFDLDWK